MDSKNISVIGLDPSNLRLGQSEKVGNYISGEIYFTEAKPVPRRNTDRMTGRGKYDCNEHYYCRCGKFNTRECHYCRKNVTTSFYRKHYICSNCRITFKGKHELELIPYVDKAATYKHEPSTNFEGARCSKCGKKATTVGRDFRAPKRRDVKAWNKIKKEINSVGWDDKYRYNCDGTHVSKGPTLYEKRKKKPWTTTRYEKDSYLL